jgi:hypothetical protein
MIQSLRAYALVIAVLAVSTIAQRIAGAPPGGSDGAAGGDMCTGRVLDLNGTPIDGATVVAYSRSMGIGPADNVQVGQLTTGKDGVFRFRGDSSRGLTILARKDGLSLDQAVWPYDSRPGEGTLRLGKPSVLAGVVVDEEGVPIAGARLDAVLSLRSDGRGTNAEYGFPGLDWLTSRTNADGEFMFAQISEDATAHFVVSAAGYSAQLAENRVSIEAGQRDIRIVVQREASIGGVVIEKIGGKPVAGVRLAVVSQSPINRHYFATTSREDGVFHLGGLPPGPVKVTTVASFYDLPDWAAGTTELNLEPGTADDGLLIEVDKGGVLELGVQDKLTGLPVPDALVVVVPKENARKEWFAARSQKDGIVRLRLALSRYVLSSVGIVAVPGYRDFQARQEFLIERGETTKVMIPIAPLRSEGTVNRPDGKPAEDAEISVPWGWNQPSAPRVRTDQRGWFAATWDYEKERNLVVARLPGSGLAGTGQMTKNGPPLSITLQAGCTIAGRVVTPDGNPIADATVSMQLLLGDMKCELGSDVRTNGMGRYEFRVVPYGYSYRLDVSADAYSAGDADIAPADLKGDLVVLEDMVLEPSNQTVSGIVVDALGNPVEGAHVDPCSKSQPWMRYGTRTDAEGRFTIQGRCKGIVRLTAWARGRKQVGYVRTVTGAKDVKIKLRDWDPELVQVDVKEDALLNRPLPPLDIFGIRTSEAAVKGRLLLVCLLDVEQAVQWDSMASVIQQSAVLKEKGVELLLVHAAPVPDDILQTVRRKRKVTLPVNVMSDATPDLLLKWGVDWSRRQCPCLLLTDRNHIVRAIGFDASQLDQRIDEAARLVRTAD